VLELYVNVNRLKIKKNAQIIINKLTVNIVFD
jgi:hypothetical protein